MKELVLINPKSVSEEEVKSYPTREAVRAVVVDDDNQIALLYVSKEDYYKLPGGGIEDDEDRETALKRECREEIGCDIEIIEEVGSVIEYREIFHIRQTSYCYLAKVSGQKGTSSYTDDELKKGFTQVWLSFEEALERISQNNATSPEGSDYIVPRDTAILEAAGELLRRL